MLRRFSFVLITVGALVALSATMVRAQVGALRGQILFKQSNGAVSPAAGAMIDIYRTDITGSYTTTTSSSGAFAFAALPFTGTYIIAASMPNARPAFQNNVKVGREIDYELTLTPGDGQRLTVTEIMTLERGRNAVPVGAPQDAADNSRRQEAEQRNREIAERNRKNIAINEIITRTFAAGNAALLAGRYDEAIVQYDEGLAADPEQAALHTNKAIALTRRGIGFYNSSIKATDDAIRKSQHEAAGRDWRDAFAAGSRAVDLAKAAPADEGNNRRLYAARAAQVEAGKLLVRIDGSVAEAVFKDYQEYIAAEPDEGRRLTARITAAQLLLDAGLAERAVTEFRKLVNENAYNVDAILGLGMALFTTRDQSRYKEAAGYLRQFVKMAPDTHPRKAQARRDLVDIEGFVKP